MNTVFFSLVVLMALSSTTLAFVCLKNVCKEAKCTAMTAENCPGKIVPNGGPCRCCDACKAVIEAGKSCAMQVFGMPSTTTCDDGLFCHPNTFTCEAIIF